MDGAKHVAIGYFALLLAFVSVAVGFRASDGGAYNDGDAPEWGTHYAHCADGHHTRRAYTNYSEATLKIVSKFGAEVTQSYKDLFLYAANWWNVQPTRVSTIPGTLGNNNWRTYNTNDGLYGYTQNNCQHGPIPHVTSTSNVWLNRFALDGAGIAIQREVVVHETGHQISLGHSQQTAGGNPIGVMWGPTITGFTQPQTDDVCGINAVFRSNTYPVNIPPCHGDHWLVP